MSSQNRRGLKHLFSFTSALVAVFGAATVAAAHDLRGAITLQAAYTGDVQGAVGGAGVRAGRYLDNLDLIADVDLEKGMGWKGAQLHGYLLSNSGGAPNDVVGTLQGVDNIEVSRPRGRLFELWLQQTLPDGRTSMLAGLYNLNSEFYVNDSAAMLIAPPFGIGSELAATGPNGPSIFPSTALGVRLDRRLGETGYVRVAVLNAKSGVVGDTEGVDLSFDDGALTIAEAGVQGPLRLGVGAWRYTNRQPDIRDLTPAGDPVRRRAYGAYVLGERRLFGDDETRSGTAFFRVGISDGDTTPFNGGWQVGLKVERVFAARPDSAVSIGVHQGRLDGKYKDNLRDAGPRPAGSETGVELTYSDRLTSRVSLQPDLQWIHGAGGEANARDRWVVGLRLKIDLSPASGG
jgi:porin